MKHIATLFALTALLLCACRPGSSNQTVTAQMALEGVSNYCHSEYDWSAAAENSSRMYVTMGEETESEYQVIFRSYTGSFVYFYVEKATGTTRLVESVPALDVDSAAGTINLFDYLGKNGGKGQPSN